MGLFVLRAVAAFAFVVTGCSALEGDNGSTSETMTLAAITPSTETGSATLTNLGDGTTQIAVTTAGGTDTGVQSAVIRTGACGSNGSIYAELNTLTNRQSITTVPYTLSTLTGAKYYIDVHDSTSVTLIDACGQIP